MDVSTFLLYLLITSSLIYIAKKIKRSYSNLPPGPSRLPIIGNLHQLGAKPHKSLAELARIHGPIMSLKLGQITAIVISSAPAAKLVLQKQDHSFANRWIPESFQIIDHGKYSVAWIPLTPKWNQLRRLCATHLFSSQKLEANGHLMQQKVEEMIADVQDKCSLGEAVLVGEAAFRASLNSLSRIILSMDLATGHSDKAREFKESFRGMLELGGTPNLADYFPWLGRFDPQRIIARMQPHVGKMMSLFDSVIDEKLAKRAAHGSVSENRDVLDSLLNIMQDETEELTRNDINHLLLDLFVAGTDTTSSTLEWAIAEVLRSPEIHAKAKSELEQATGKGQLIQDADIAHLPYLQAIVKETLRLHPATPLLLPRKTLENVELSGFTVPKGAQVIVNAWAIGRDPSSIWDNPDRFDPERFLGSDVSFVRGNSELIPFGGGRRICPGLPLAVKMLHLMLGSLLNSFDWRLEDGMKPEDVDMDDKFGLTLLKSQPLSALPLYIK